MWSVVVVCNKQESGAYTYIPAAGSGSDTVQSVPPHFMQFSLPYLCSRDQIGSFNPEWKDLSNIIDDDCQLSLSISEATGIQA